MGPIEITIIVLTVIAVCIILGVYIYKKVKGLPTGDCGCCTSRGSKLVKKYHKKYKNSCKQENDNKSCCCCENKQKDK